MKKILLVAAVAALAACNSNDKSKVDAMSVKGSDSLQQNVQYAYPVAMSKFQIGDANNAKMITEIWKDWDNGNLQNHKDYFADNVSFYVADGPPMIGPRDSVLASAQTFRNTISASESSIDAIVPLNNLDSTQNWVAIWGKEIDTYKSGKKDTTYLNEAWRLNKDNKVDLVYQYNSRPVAMSPANKK
ncbi:MAG TPA: hypothetical protein VKC90_03765 [Chitinophagaceae bacterium]|nr:hypothetical protein [Chitinophagaceae bacterium]